MMQWVLTYTAIVVSLLVSIYKTVQFFRVQKSANACGGGCSCGSNACSVKTDLLKHIKEK